MTVTFEQSDAAVVGSGFAGLAAAIEVAEAGCSVVVLEKMMAFGGNSAISDGGIAAPGIDYQVAAGINDSPELMFNKPGIGKELTSHARRAVIIASGGFGSDVAFRQARQPDSAYR